MYLLLQIKLYHARSILQIKLSHHVECHIKGKNIFNTQTLNEKLQCGAKLCMYSARRIELHYPAGQSVLTLQTITICFKPLPIFIFLIGILSLT